MDMNALMRQAQSMQKQMIKKQKEVEEKEFTVASNGGAIQITIKGDKKVLKIEIDEDLIDVENKEMLQEMLIIAINDAIKKVEDAMGQAMNGATGGMNIPGFF
jgi:DNA-binding YbaB/EbfC family protein